LTLNGKERLNAASQRFSEAEAQYLAENFIGRIATVSPSGQPHVVPVGYEFDGRSISFSGRSLTKSLKYRNMMANRRVAFVVDDIVSTSPWKVRGVEVRGDAEPVLSEQGLTTIRIIPFNIRSWGLGA